MHSPKITGELVLVFKSHLPDGLTLPGKSRVINLRVCQLEFNNVRNFENLYRPYLHYGHEIKRERN